MQQARADLKQCMSEMAFAEQEPSLAAATTASTVLKAAHRAIAAEALLASLMLGLAETNTQVCPYLMQRHCLSLCTKVLLVAIGMAFGVTLG